MMRRLVVLVTAVLAVACSSAPSDPNTNPLSNENTRFSGVEIGPTPVGTIPDARFRDDARNKDIEINIDYPTRGGPHPLILFSPGFGGSHRGYVGLSSYWAANNYVVIRVNHADRTSGVTSIDDVWANATSADWRDRVRDITFVLDSLDRLTERYPELQGKIDATKAGVAGHSYGAHTAMLVAGVRTFPGGVSYADPRVKAVIAMSPQGPSDSRGLTRDSWTDLRVPALFMTGTLDQGTTEAETPEWRTEAFRLSPAGDKWLVSLEGAGHTTFGGMAGSLEQIAKELAEIERAGDVPGVVGPDDPSRVPGTPYVPELSRRDPRYRTPAEGGAMRQRALFSIVRGVALSFFDAYLREDAPAREALEQAGTRKAVVLEKK
jgi:predicted dienelactone hydrolase